MVYKRPPLHCQECGGYIKRVGHPGRQPLVCSDRCKRVRDRRLKKKSEIREYARKMENDWKNRPKVFLVRRLEETLVRMEILERILKNRGIMMKD